MTKDHSFRPDLSDPQSALDAALTAGFLFDPIIRDEGDRAVILHPDTTRVPQKPA